MVKKCNDSYRIIEIIQTEDVKEEDLLEVLGRSIIKNKNQKELN